MSKIETAGSLIMSMLAVAAILVLSFLITAAVSCGFCWAFGLSWSWRIALGVWLAYGVITTTASAVARQASR